MLFLAIKHFYNMETFGILNLVLCSPNVIHFQFCLKQSIKPIVLFSLCFQSCYFLFIVTGNIYKIHRIINLLTNIIITLERQYILTVPCCCEA